MTVSAVKVGCPAAMRIKLAYAQYYRAARSERLALEVVDLVTRLERVAQARYAGGLAAQQDAIRAQLELTAMRSELLMLKTEKRQASTRLNALLAREVGSPLAEPLLLRPLPTVSVADASGHAERARAGTFAIVTFKRSVVSANGSGTTWTQTAAEVVGR